MSWEPIKVGERPPPMWLRDKKDSYRKQVHGILPGYGGYVPQSANKVGTAVTGAVNGLTHQTLQQGTQGTRATPSYRRTPMSVNHSSTTAGYPHTSSPSKSKVDFELSYRSRPTSDGRKGIVPGYGGHVPNAQSKYGASHEGNMPRPPHAYKAYGEPQGR
uniref:Uncharacterized protein n=1 Tax=Haptolina ericina TaxID=156174 RepID=A0A7S3EXS6_9EUKA|mmetsp:Transcript_28640/g.64868  ORF Transcript_28640/g.64868 Transcript_28640/m.64868 type:complete len:160 (+) Transcript_28640:41-520(+)